MTYRTGNHHGVTIVSEGDGIRCDRPGHDCERGHLTAVVVNGGQESSEGLAGRICTLLNGDDAKPQPPLPAPQHETHPADTYRHDYAFAAWFLDDHGQPDYDLCLTEEEAARCAAAVEVHSDGIVLGLQRADGSLLPAVDWPTFGIAAVEMRRAAGEQQTQRKPRPSRLTRDPFAGRPLNIETSEPAWLGQEPS